MNKLQKIIIGIIIFTIIAVGVVIGSVKFKEHQANKIPKDIIDELNENANKQLETLLKEETDKLKAQYEAELKACNPEEDPNAFKPIPYYDLILRYYDKAEKDKLIMEETVNDNGVVDYKLTFNKDNTDSFIEDNESKKQHSYKIEHKKNITKENKLKLSAYEIIINMTSSEKEKFDIKNSKMINDYIEQLLGRYLTDDEKSIINIATNMDIENLDSLKDLEKYVYEKEGIKIDDLIITSNSNLDEVSGKYVSTFILKTTVSEKIED